MEAIGSGDARGPNRVNGSQQRIETLTRAVSGLTVDDMEKTLRLSHYGKQLWARAKAREVRAELEGILEQLAEGDAAVIDASGVDERAIDQLSPGPFAGLRLGCQSSSLEETPGATGD